MQESKTVRDVRWFYPRMISVESRVCCPTCGHIIGGRMKWDYPPIVELPASGDMEGQSIFVGTVIAECPDCKSYFTQQEVTAYDRDTVENYITKARNT